MNREQAKELLPIIQAYAEGKTIQIYNIIIHDWIDDTEYSDLQFNLDPSQYRIKPELTEVKPIVAEDLKKDNEPYYVILNMNMRYEICRKCPKSGLFSGTIEDCQNWICNQCMRKGNNAYCDDCRDSDLFEEKPEVKKKLVPFSSQEEFVNYYCKNISPSNASRPENTMPIIWIKHPNDDVEQVVAFVSNGIGTWSGKYTFKELFDEGCTFMNGEKIGILK